MAWWKECFETPEDASRFLKAYNTLTKEYEKTPELGHLKQKENKDYDEAKRKLAKFIGTRGVQFVERKLKQGEGLIADELKILVEGKIPNIDGPEFEER